MLGVDLHRRGYYQDIKLGTGGGDHRPGRTPYRKGKGSQVIKQQKTVTWKWHRGGGKKGKIRLKRSWKFGNQKVLVEGFISGIASAPEEVVGGR